MQLPALQCFCQMLIFTVHRHKELRGLVSASISFSSFWLGMTRDMHVVHGLFIDDLGAQLEQCR